MKLLCGFVILSIVFIALSPAYAGDDNAGVSRQLNPSALSIARVQMMQRHYNHLTSNEVNSFSFSDQTTSSDQATGYKDRKKAFFYSLILPGAGEYYLGKRNFARAFFATEVTLWLSYFAFQQYGKWVREDALAFAATHSGANIEGKPSQFFVDIGNYTDIYQYNDAKLRYGEYEKYYTEADYFWAWDQDGNRQKFENMRIASDRARNRSTYVLGAVVANHLLSAIHASWQTHRYNKNIDKLSATGIDFQIRADYLNPKITFTLKTVF
jgi:hypothetical protein